MGADPWTAGDQGTAPCHGGKYLTYDICSALEDARSRDRWFTVAVLVFFRRLVACLPAQIRGSVRAVRLALCGSKLEDPLG